MLQRTFLFVCLIWWGVLFSWCQKVIERNTLIEQQLSEYPAMMSRVLDYHWINTGLHLQISPDHNIWMTWFEVLRLLPDSQSWSENIKILNIDTLNYIPIQLPWTWTQEWFIVRGNSIMGQQFNNSWYTYLVAHRIISGLSDDLNDYRIFQVSYTGNIQEYAQLPYDIKTHNFTYLSGENLIAYEKSGETFYIYNINTSLLTLWDTANSKYQIFKDILLYGNNWNYKVIPPQWTDMCTDNCLVEINNQIYKPPYNVIPVSKDLIFVEYVEDLILYRGIISVSTLTPIL